MSRRALQGQKQAPKQCPEPDIHTHAYPPKHPNGRFSVSFPNSSVWLPLQVLPRPSPWKHENIARCSPLGSPVLAASPMTTLAVTYTELTKRESSRSLPVSSLDSGTASAAAGIATFALQSKANCTQLSRSCEPPSRSHRAVSHRVIQG